MKKGKRDKWSPPFVRMEKRLLLKDENWHQLSQGAKVLYLILKSKYNGQNNGQIRLHYSELQNMRGFRSPRAIAAAFKELEQDEWIERTKKGGLFRYVNEYRLTGKFDGLL